MMRGGESEFYEQSFRPPSGWQGMAFAFLWGLGFGSAALMAPWIGLLFGLIGWGVSLGVVWTVIRHLRGLRRGVKVSAAGLTEVFWLQPPRFVSWDLVRGVEMTSTGASVKTEVGDIVLDGELRDWVRLARRIEAVLGIEEEPDEGPLVEPDEVAEWLGIEPSGALVCRPTGSIGAALALVPVWLLVTAGLAAFYSVFIMGALKAGGRMRVGMLMFTMAHASIFFGVLSGGLLMAIVKRFKAAVGAGIVADVTGLTLEGGRKHIAWSEIRGIEMRDGEWHVSAEHDSFVIGTGYRNTGRLVTAIQQAVRAAQEGRRLPRLGPVPAGAISLAREGRMGPEPDRGISLLESDTEA